MQEEIWPYFGYQSKRRKAERVKFFFACLVSDPYGEKRKRSSASRKNVKNFTFKCITSTVKRIGSMGKTCVVIIAASRTELIAGEKTGQDLFRGAERHRFDRMPARHLPPPPYHSCR